MNMHAQPQRTAAETALIDAFAARFSDLPGDPAVAQKRDAAIEQVKAGLPTRHVEAWHYTDLRRLLAKVPAAEAGTSANPVEALLSGSAILPILNGAALEKTPAIDGLGSSRRSR